MSIKIFMQTLSPSIQWRFNYSEKHWRLRNVQVPLFSGVGILIFTPTWPRGLGWGEDIASFVPIKTLLSYIRCWCRERVGRLQASVISLLELWDPPRAVELVVIVGVGTMYQSPEVWMRPSPGQGCWGRGDPQVQALDWVSQLFPPKALEAGAREVEKAARPCLSHCLSLCPLKCRRSHSGGGSRLRKIYFPGARPDSLWSWVHHPQMVGACQHHPLYSMTDCKER